MIKSSQIHKIVQTLIELLEEGKLIFTIFIALFGFRNLKGDSKKAHYQITTHITMFYKEIRSLHHKRFLALSILQAIEHFNQLGIQETSLAHCLV